MKRTIIIQTHILNILTADELHRFVDNLLRMQSPRGGEQNMKSKSTVNAKLKKAKTAKAKKALKAKK